ncbi:sorting nexin 2A-like isoform X3 [Silene latifolia]|uniref:sorting nexin 2A-like isoform X3 n=1 Tax=Silene latifolia TaxID=37657 RepID=UPI003D782CFF
MMDHNHHDSTNDSSEFMDDLTLHDNHQPSSHASDFPEISAIADHLPAKNPNSSLNSFVDPPSYADAMFRSFDADSIAEINGHHRLNSLSFSSSEEPSEFLHISVSDPQKVPESSNSLVPGGSYYYNYLITTRTNLDNFSSTEFSVRRRFSEVVTLSDRLSECYRGYVIPLRPDKSIMESQMMQKTEFVEQRRVAVEKYLKKLAAHPTIRKSEELRVFLEVDGRLGFVNTIDVASRMLDGVVKLPGQLIGETAMAAEEVVQPAKGGRDLFRLFKELKQAVSNDWSGVKPSVVEEDKEFLEKKVRLNELEQQLSNVSEQDKLHDYLGMMLAVDNAFTERSNALLTVQTLATELSSLQSRIEKLEIAASKIFGGDRSRMRKIEELKETMKVTEDAKLCAVKEYERIKENNKNELDRIEKERHSDFLSMLKGFVVNQTATFLLNLQTGICDHLMVKCNHNGTTTVAAYGNLFFNSGHIWL